MDRNFLALYVFALCIWTIKIALRVNRKQKVNCVTYLVMFCPAVNVVVLIIDAFLGKDNW